MTFDQDNCNGYSDQELAAMNAEWDEIVDAADFAPYSNEYFAREQEFIDAVNHFSPRHVKQVHARTRPQHITTTDTFGIPRQWHVGATVLSKVGVNEDAQFEILCIEEVRGRAAGYLRELHNGDSDTYIDLHLRNQHGGIIVMSLESCWLRRIV